MSLWDEGRAKDAVDSVAAKLRVGQPGMRDQTWIRGNDVYPLRATTSLNVSGPPWDDDVVLSASIKIGESALMFDSDISDGSGQILVDGPQSTISANQSADERATWADECLEQYVRFLNQNVQVMADELSRRT